MLIGIDPATPLARLVAAYVVFGLSFGFVNAPIANAAVSGTPRAQAGANATGVVDGLESLKLARRQPHPTDRRAKVVEVTRTGEDLTRRAHAIRGTLPPELSTLSADDRETLQRILASLPVPSGKERP